MLAVSISYEKQEVIPLNDVPNRSMLVADVNARAIWNCSFGPAMFGVFLELNFFPKKLLLLDLSFIPELFDGKSGNGCGMCSYRMAVSNPTNMFVIGRPGKSALNEPFTL